MVTAWQLIKQPDVLVLYYLLGERELSALLRRLGYACDEGCARRSLDYYLPRMAHESSLSRGCRAGACARLAPERSWRYFTEALKVDAQTKSASSTAEGLHLGAMAGLLGVLLRHHAGLEFDGGGLYQLDGSAGRVTVRPDESNRCDVDVIHAGSAYRLVPGSAVSVTA